MSVDSNLVGIWQAGTSTIKIADDGFLYRLGTAPASISADGSELTILNTIYGRVYGTGTDIVGVWSYSEDADNSTWVEEVHYRDDGSYIGSWTKDGQFDSLWSGYYTFAGGNLATEERRALVETGPSGTINFDYPYDVDESGTYSFAVNGDLILTVNGSVSTYSKVAS